MTDKRFDSLIFDMDGTLWDAVDTYVDIWRTTYERMGVDARIDRPMLLKCMGLPLDQIFDRLAPKTIDRKEFETTIRQVDATLMPREGGRLYPGVAATLPILAKDYRLFLVSNCGPNGLDYFLQYTGLTPYFTDHLSYGQTMLPKEGNIRLLQEKYNLVAPVYIGDTEGDCRSAHAAGIPMIHVTYGFGKCSNAEYSADSFTQIPDILTT
ncbi:MAG: HAD family hydrolase [Bacteroides sp.]|nr:HAD family hydrolase [Bacteroides sp.]MCM1412846.1 HAD family hydrolase [Bacteroides sp.]MCM1471515.1 HAD family hydrolase [Bacteroides sp.]